MSPQPNLQNFLKHISYKSNSCWLWTGYIDPNGYGRFAVKRSGKTAHHVAWLLFRGPVPKGLMVDHAIRCNRACVNPDHLDLVTNRENQMRAKTLSSINATKTQCIRGHPFDDTNTIYTYRQGWIRRECRICRHLRNTTGPLSSCVP